MCLHFAGWEEDKPVSVGETVRRGSYLVAVSLSGFVEAPGPCVQELLDSRPP